MIIIYLTYFFSSLLKLHFRNHFSVLISSLPIFSLPCSKLLFSFLSNSKKSTQKLYWLVQKLHLRKLTLEKSQYFRISRKRKIGFQDKKISFLSSWKRSKYIPTYSALWSENHILTNGTILINKIHPAPPLPTKYIEKRFVTK